MGIKHLWTILTPFCERKPLYELQGKTVAVDLSCWICEAQNIAEYQVQPRMYLRNLYFRTCYLLLMQVNPVFVLEGRAPELKYQTIASRNEVQFKGAKPKKNGVKTGKDRSRFHFVLRQCEEMLKYMGLVCIKGEGEAESLCAYLNDEGLVDGCISQDSDCFAYGAKIVYRNFSISSQGSYSASGGAVDIYDITKAYESLNFGRNKMVAMALLCGSDYCEGVHGVGKESVVKLFEKLSDEETLDRLRSWRSSPNLYEKFEKQISDKNICTSCGHQGRIQLHTKNGCTLCSTTKGCDPFKFKEERLYIKNEVNIRLKALENPNFPDEGLINEFLVKKDNVSKLNPRWKQPDLLNFVKFATKFLQWEAIYAFEKLLPILTRWQCLNYELIQKQDDVRGILYPDHIKKARNPKGILSYEIIWTDPKNYFKELIPEDQLMQHNIDLEKLWSTIEPQGLVELAYPKLVEDYKLSKIKPKKVSKRKKKGLEDDALKNSSVSQPEPKKTRKTKTTKKKSEDEVDGVVIVAEKRKASKKKDVQIESEVLKDLENSFNELEIEKPKLKTTTLENFFKKAVLNSQKLKNSEINIDGNNAIEKSNKNQARSIYQTSTPAKPDKHFSFNLDTSNFGDEDDSDLSDIIEEMISKKRPGYIENNLRNINLSSSELECNDANSSSFFITKPVEDDLFEKTFNVIEADDDESTEEYEFDEKDLLPAEEDNVKCGEDKSEDNDKNCSAEDSFCDTYVPLYERLKRK